LSDQRKKEDIKFQIGIMEKEIHYYKGRKHAKARKAYLRLLQSCGKACRLDEPVYLKRSE
jgi:hypothetical protein